MPTRRPRKDMLRNRAALLTAAREVFASKGLDAPLDLIAREAGVGIGTLYRHFPTRTALFDELLTESMAHQLAIAEQALAIEDPWEGFVHYLVETAAREAEDRSMNDMMSMRMPKMRCADALRRRVFDAMNELVARAQESGQLRPDVTAEDLAFVRWSNWRILEATGSVAPEVWRRFLGLLLDGLRADAASPLPEPPLTPRQTYRAMLTVGRRFGG